MHAITMAYSNISQMFIKTCIFGWQCGHQKTEKFTITIVGAQKKISILKTSVLPSSESATCAGSNALWKTCKQQIKSAQQSTYYHWGCNSFYFKVSS